MKFYIVNDMDRPEPSLVAYERHDGKLNYLDRTKKSHDGMEKDRATDLVRFGFSIEYGQTEVIFSQWNPSTATYKDGKPRQWQGDTTFSRPMPEDTA